MATAIETALVRVQISLRLKHPTRRKQNPLANKLTLFKRNEKGICRSCPAKIDNRIEINCPKCRAKQAFQKRALRCRRITYLPKSGKELAALSAPVLLTNVLALEARKWTCRHCGAHTTML